MGDVCEDEGRALGLHGRVSNLPATNVAWGGEWEGEDYVLSVSGKIRETIVFGENILLTRRIWARLGESRFFIDDVVENRGYRRTPHMILYHINTGFPVVSDNTYLLSHSVNITPRDAIAEEDKENYHRMQPPTQDYQAKVYFHDMRADAQGRVTTALVLGRATELEAGRLQFLEPGERREYHLEIGVVEGAEQIAALEKAMKG